MITSSDGRVEAARSGAGVRCLPWLQALIILASLAALLTAPLPTGAADMRHFVWDRVDVVVALQEDSSLHVTERDRISFSCGPFQEGYRDIPLTRIERIDAIHVQEVAANSLLPYRTVSPGSFSRANPNTYSVQRIGANSASSGASCQRPRRNGLPDRLQRPRGTAGLR